MPFDFDNPDNCIAKPLCVLGGVFLISGLIGEFTYLTFTDNNLKILPQVLFATFAITGIICLLLGSAFAYEFEDNSTTGIIKYNNNNSPWC